MTDRDKYRPGRRRRKDVDWQLGHDRALIWRDGRAQLVDVEEATPRERETGIASVEALALHVLNVFQTRKRAYIDPSRREDAVAYLIEQAWIEARRFNGRGRLGGFVTSRLPWRLMDWYRAEFRQPVAALSLDVAAEPTTEGTRDGDRDHDIEPTTVDDYDLTRDSLTLTSRALYDLLLAGYSAAEIGRAYDAAGKTTAKADLAALRAELAALA